MCIRDSGDAEATLAAMEDIIDRYDEVTLEAFYELVGKPELCLLYTSEYTPPSIRPSNCPLSRL